jgi:hypothetical protein
MELRITASVLSGGHLVLPPKFVPMAAHVSTYSRENIRVARLRKAAVCRKQEAPDPAGGTGTGAVGGVLGRNKIAWTNQTATAEKIVLSADFRH